jgi:hypothetical protein
MQLKGSINGEKNNILIPAEIIGLRKRCLTEVQDEVQFKGYIKNCFLGYLLIFL